MKDVLPTSSRCSLTGNASEQAYNRVSFVCLLCCVLLCNCNASHQVQVIKACARVVGPAVCQKLHAIMSASYCFITLCHHLLHIK
jgi:hypothetical protein